jgi:hypothetical protein
VLRLVGLPAVLVVVLRLVDGQDECLEEVFLYRGRVAESPPVSQLLGLSRFLWFGRRLVLSEAFLASRWASQPRYSKGTLRAKGMT